MSSSNDELAGLRTGQVHVWLGRTDAYDIDGVSTPDAGLLGPQERLQVDRLVLAADWQRAIVSRLVLRTTLSRYFPKAPAEWVFGFNANGKPHVVDDDPSVHALQFNMSHSANMIAVAVALDVPVGIDIELVNRPGIDASLVAEAFAAHERSDLELLEGDARRLRMFRYWTLKEAFAKGLGMDLARAMTGISFDLSQPAHIGMHVDPGFEAAPEAWTTWQWHCAGDCLVALCARTGSGAEVSVRWFNSISGDVAEDVTLVGGPPPNRRNLSI